MICAVVFYFGTAAAQPATPATEDAFENQFNQLQEIFSFIMMNKPLVSAMLLFMNNYLSMAQMLLLGVVAGITPLITLGLNGALVGMLLSLTVQEGIPLLPMLVFGILPHGLFELFAFFLCGAIGLKFGYHCIASPLPGKTRLESYRYIWKEAISLMPLVVLLLLIAALVEIFITQHLIALVYP